MIMMTAKKPGEPLIEPARDVSLALWRLVLAGENFRQKRAQELCLGPSDVVALGHVYEHQPLSPKELSILMGVTSGTMTALLDRVEQAGFLRRENNPRDRRGQIITLTSAGHDALQRLYEQLDTAVRETMARTPELAAEHVRTALRVLSEALEAAAGGEDPSLNIPP